MLKQKAIGYVCDIPIPETDIVITKEDQRIRILNYAQEENLELIGMYEDEEYTDDFINRPGVQNVLNCKEDFEVLLVERVWCLSRKMKELSPFLDQLCKKNIELKTSSYLWDCASQQVRHYHLVEKLRKARAEARRIKEAA